MGGGTGGGGAAARPRVAAHCIIAAAAAARGTGARSAATGYGGWRVVGRHGEAAECAVSCGSRDMRARLGRTLMVKEEGQERGLRLEAREAAGQQAAAGTGAEGTLEGRTGSIGPGQGLPQRGKTTVAEYTSQLAALLDRSASPQHTHSPPPRSPASSTGSRWRPWARCAPPPCPARRGRPAPAPARRTA